MSGKREHLARWLTGQGIEIGAPHRPLKVPASAHVRYVDRLPEAELRKHYPELDGQPLAPVSILGSAEDLSSIQDDSLDFVIANHLLEHLEYPVRGLAEFHRFLKAGGSVYMALPDQRLTFDRDRPLTPVEHLLLEHRNGNAERNRRAHYMDYVLHVNGTPRDLRRKQRLTGCWKWATASTSTSGPLTPSSISLSQLGARPAFRSHCWTSPRQSTSPMTSSSYCSLRAYRRGHDCCCRHRRPFKSTRRGRLQRRAPVCCDPS